MNGEDREDEKRGNETNFLLVLLRCLRWWNQSDLAQASGVAQAQMSVYDGGIRPAPRPVLDKAAGAVDFPQDLIAPALRGLRSFRAAARGRSRADRVLVDATWADLLVLLGEVADLLLAPRRIARSSREVRRPSPADREGAAALCARLRRRRPAERELLLAEPEYRTWTVAEGLASESVALAPNAPQEALALARLGLRIAETISGGEAWRRRLTGYLLAHVANARKVCGDLPEAGEDLARAARLWEEGVSGDPGLLNPAMLPWIEAALRKDQRRLGEAREKIEEALALAGGELRGKILLTKSNILRRLDDPQGSTAALEEAAPLIDAGREPRLALVVRYNLIVDLCELHRAAEAAPRLAEVRGLAERLGGKLDLARTTWLEGKVAYGLGCLAEARSAFEHVRQAFAAEEMPYDCALFSLDLALVLLAEGRIAEVRRLAEEMLWLFKAQSVHREALAALHLFCDAARREAATADLAQSVSRYLRRAQDDPGLRFAGRQEAEAP